MGIETATYINDLQSANPGSTDLRSQGDDHLRLIKSVLQNSFPRSSRPRPIETAVQKSANFSVASTDDQTLYFIDTSGGSVTVTLPALTASDVGWKTEYCKTSTDANPIFFVVSGGANLVSGSLTSTRARRAIPGKYISVRWGGAAHLVERVNSLPVGSLVDFFSSTLPPGFEWPNGQTLASASTNYPEYNSANGSGTTLDFRGRTSVTLDNLGGSAAGRLAGGIITGTTVGNTGGSDTRQLVTANLPAYTPSGTITNGTIFVSSTNNAIAITGAAGAGVQNNAGGWIPYTSALFSASQNASSFSGNAQGGTSTAFGIMQPSIICAKILVVE